jgi:DNA-binding beta-propeller fold protein YncE
MNTRRIPTSVVTSIFGFLLSTPALGGEEEATPGYLYVTSYHTDEIFKFDRAGVLADVIDSFYIDGPEGLAFGPDGKLYVASRDNDRVVGWEENSLGEEVIDLAEFDEPIAVAIGPNGNLYVSCAGNGRIVECTLSGVFVRSIGAGSGMAGPSQVLFGADGHLFAADTGTDQVFEFDPSGEFIRAFGGGAIGAPLGIARAPGGSAAFWVSSLGDDSIKCFDTDGSVIDTFSHASIDGPRQMTGGPDGYLYVASDVSDRVVVFDPMTQQFVREIGTGLGIDGVGGVAFEPYFILLRAKGRVALENEFTKVNQNVALRYAPGSGTLMFATYTPDPGQPSFLNHFDSHYAVLHGFEQAKDSSLFVEATGMFGGTTGAGFIHSTLLFTGKRGANEQFKINSVKGSLSRVGLGSQLAVKLTETEASGGGSK